MGTHDGILNSMQYVLLTPDGMEYYISLSYPVEAEEHIAKQLHEMLQSFQISEN